MRYAGIIENDIVDGIDGLSVSLWTQGCPHRCPGCHNPQTWDYNGGEEIPENIIDILKTDITKNGILRNLSILGGEPLCPQNIDFIKKVVIEIKKFNPNIRIIMWTGYYLKEIKRNRDLQKIFNNIDYLIDGRFDINNRDVTLRLRGSKNQSIYRVYKKRNKPIFINITKEIDSI